MRRSGAWRLLFVAAIHVLLALESFVSALTFTRGQRIAPLSTSVERRHDSWRPNDTHADVGGDDDDDYDDYAVVSLDQGKARLHSLFDLPRVEQWASRRGISEHHLKTLYNVILTSRPPPPTAILDDTTTETTRSDGHDDARSSSSASILLKKCLLQQNFPSRHVDDLLSQFTLCTLSLVQVQRSNSSAASGHFKFISRLSRSNGHNNQFIETVVIQHATTKQSTSSMSASKRATKLSSSVTGKNTRYTVCVSSQVGCRRACSFCATGTLGLQAQLSSAEILEQVFLAQHILDQGVVDGFGATNETIGNISSSSSSSSHACSSSLRNVVFMGMGEPLDNYRAVHEACRGLTHQGLFGLRASRITVSTVGVSPRMIQRLADEAPTIRLAISLHGATGALRGQLMPATQRSGSSLVELEEALDYYAIRTGLGVMLEYLLIDNVNDNDKAATALIEFCQRRRQIEAPHHRRAESYVNLIPYNPTSAGHDFGYTTPSDVKIQAFADRLLAAGIFTRGRWSTTASRDTNGACGQLALLSGNEH